MMCNVRHCGLVFYAEYDPDVSPQCLPHILLNKLINWRYYTADGRIYTWSIVRAKKAFLFPITDVGRYNH